MTRIAFRKMHGAGNDFVVLDSRKRPIELNEEQLRHIADRRFGIGCDQIVVIEPSQKADAFMRIYNADGSMVSSCGNASRCVAWLLMQESGQAEVHIETSAGLLSCKNDGEDMITVNMGRPKHDWQEIPLSNYTDTLRLELQEEGVSDAVAVNMGNPHAVFFVEDITEIKLSEIGPRIETHTLFPERVNVEVAQIVNDKAIRLRVWERGAGETLACGTGACAALVAAHRRGLTGRKADVMLPGGMLQIYWQEEAEGGAVLMTGPVMQSFTGEIML